MPSSFQYNFDTNSFLDQLKCNIQTVQSAQIFKFSTQYKIYLYKRVFIYLN